MADYNVNMKQWNGTSFDNVLPLAYNAKQLEGQSLAEVKQWVQDNGLLLYTGEYIGNGTYGYSNRVKISFPFKPLLIILPPPILPSISTYTTMENSIGYFSSGSGSNDKKVYGGIDGNTVFYYSEDDSSYQANMKNKLYSFAAIGGYNMGGSTEWLITSSGSWTVPRTGRYYIELYGGGGGVDSYGEVPRGSVIQGGSSCQSYSSINLVARDSIAVTIGVGGASDYGYAYQATGTSFGAYSVDGGGMGNGISEEGGSGSGNLGTSGSVVRFADADYNNNKGILGSTYGQGGYGGRSGSSFLGKKGTDGAVYLKYLGA